MVSLDRNSRTCTSIFLWCLQLSLRLNIFTSRDAQSILVENKRIEMKEGKLPKDFDPANLTNLFVDQFVTWDEGNRKAMPGSYDGYARTPYKGHIIK